MSIATPTRPTSPAGPADRRSRGPVAWAGRRPPTARSGRRPGAPGTAHWWLRRCRSRRTGASSTAGPGTCPGTGPGEGVGPGLAQGDRGVPARRGRRARRPGVDLDAAGGAAGLCGRWWHRYTASARPDATRELPGLPGTSDGVAAWTSPFIRPNGIDRRGRRLIAVAVLAAIAVIASSWVGLLVFLGGNAAAGSLDDLSRAWIPDVESMSLDLPDLGRLSEVYTSDDVLLGQLTERNSQPTAFEEIPDLVMAAVLSAEDADFWTHPGIDHRAIIRSPHRATSAAARQPGWVHHHPAGGQAELHRHRAHAAPQGVRGHHRHGAGAPLHQGADPRVLPELGVLRRQRLRRAGGCPGVLRQDPRPAQHRRSRRPGGPHPQPHPVQPAQRHRRPAPTPGTR